MNPTPQTTTTQERLSHATADYHCSAAELTAALEADIARRARASFPAGTRLKVVGLYGDDGTFKLRARGVYRGGEALHRADPAAWDDLTDSIDPDLHWLGDLASEDYLLEHNIGI